MDPLFEIKVKKAFSKIKEDITCLKNELNTLKNALEGGSSELQAKNPYNELINKNSTGNKGVYAFIHSFNHSLCTHSNTHSRTYSDPFSPTSFEKLPETLTFNQKEDNYIKNDPFQAFTNKEFLVFLTIYQLEKEVPHLTYEVLSKKLTLTCGCIRSYITSLMRKKAPLIKTKLNNKLVLLSIDPVFRSLTSEQKLIDLYYQNDPHQSTLM